MAFIKRPRLVRNRMHKDATNPHDRGGLLDAQHRVLQKRHPNPLSLHAAVDRQPAQDCHGDRIGHVPLDPAGRFRMRKRAGGQRVIAHHAVFRVATT